MSCWANDYVKSRLNDLQSAQFESIRLIWDQPELLSPLAQNVEDDDLGEVRQEIFTSPNDEFDFKIRQQKQRAFLSGSEEPSKCVREERDINEQVELTPAVFSEVQVQSDVEKKKHLSRVEKQTLICSKKKLLPKNEIPLDSKEIPSSGNQRDCSSVRRMKSPIDLINAQKNQEPSYTASEQSKKYSTTKTNQQRQVLTDAKPKESQLNLPPVVLINRNHIQTKKGRHILTAALVIIQDRQEIIMGLTKEPRSSLHIESKKHP